MLRPTDFQDVFARGSRIVRKPVGLVFAERSFEKARMGLAISKKAVPLATMRNRLKRMIRDSFRRAAQGLPPVDIVIYLQPGTGTIAATRLRQILAQLWNELSQRCVAS